MKKVNFLIAIIVISFLNFNDLLAQTKIEGWNNNLIISTDDSTLMAEGWIENSFRGVTFKSYYCNPLIDTISGTIMFHTVQVYEDAEVNYLYSDLGPKKQALIGQCDFIVNILTNKIAKFSVSVFYKDEDLLTLFYLPLSDVVSGIDEKYWEYDPNNVYVRFAQSLASKN
jgi:hypothetical protein